MFDRSDEFLRLTSEVNSAEKSTVYDVEIGEILRTAPLALDDFVVAQDAVEASCVKIEQLIGEIDQLHRNALVTVDPEDSARLGKKLEAAGLLASSESASVRRILKTMAEQTGTLTGELSETDFRLRESKQRSLCKKFMTLMEQFERMQSANKAKYQKQVERQFLLVKPEATEAELEKLRESPQLMAQQMFALSSRAQAGQTLQVLQDRQAEIHKLEKGMQELHELFLDISFLVSQQGYTIDRIEEYVDSSSEATKQAAEVMKEVVVKQRRAQRRRWFMAGIGVVILVILIVIIILALTNNL